MICNLGESYLNITKPSGMYSCTMYVLTGSQLSGGP